MLGCLLFYNGWVGGGVDGRADSTKSKPLAANDVHARGVEIVTKESGI